MQDKYPRSKKKDLSSFYIIQIYLIERIFQYYTENNFVKSKTFGLKTFLTISV